MGAPAWLGAAAVAAFAAAAPLAGCGQKGPLFLPVAKAQSAKSGAHVPSAPEDRVPPGPELPPMPSDAPVPAPTGVVPPK